jgi:L-fuculose-phosphate aldolase
MAYLGKVARVPYHHAGSRDLAEAAASTAPTSQVLLLENHGVVCWGASLDDALLKTETLELLCRLLIVSRASNVRLNYLGESVMQSFRQHLQGLGQSA